MTAPQGQVPVTVRTFAQRFSATRRGARLARLLAVHQLTAWGFAPGVGGYDAAILVVTELSANAALHGRVPGRDFAVRLAYDERGGVLEKTVWA
ncbi:ATP-binding protein, partial [Streptomyces javensis]|nr:ATP-binding protein [Streptomyces javensis]